MNQLVLPSRPNQLEAWRLEQLETETAARITWGESPAELRQWLLSMDLADFYVDAILRDCLNRRAGEMRMLGMWNLLWGSLSMVSALVVGVGGWMSLDWLEQQGWPSPAGLYGVIFGPAALLFIYATWQLWLAFDRLVFGARADGAVK